MSFSYNERQKNIATLKEETIDLLIIGGGITGAGVAVQAAASGMQTALVEMQDFAEGTSSRSTKLVHGGIRYLKNFDVEVVSDTVTERANVQRIAPHIPKPDPMLLPIYNEPGATFNMFSVKVAMDLYDQLANVTGTKYANYTLTKDEVLAREPQLKPDNLMGAGVYLDFRNNDARLVIENIKRAQADGGMMLSRVKVVAMTHDTDGQVNGAEVEDLLTGEHFNIKARLVINTTGPWSDEVRKLDQKNDLPAQMRPTKGVHLVVDQSKLNVPQPTYFDTGKNDGRMVFVVPREEKTYFGTTDTDYTGDLSNPTVTQEDVDYLLAVVNNRFPEANIQLADIESSWAGLRPLIVSGGGDYNGGKTENFTDESFTNIIETVESFLNDSADRTEVEKAIKSAKTTGASNEVNPSQVSRGSSLDVSADGLITLAGGKITDYRLMAEGALDLIQQLLADKFTRSFTLIDSKNYPVSGGEIDHTNVDEEIAQLATLAEEKGLSAKDALYLANLYGSNLPKVLTYDTLVEGLDMKESMSLNYSLAEEMVLTPVDHLLRRTNHILFIRDTLDALIEPVIAKMAEVYQWSAEETTRQREQLQHVVAESDLQYLKEA